VRSHGVVVVVSDSFTVGGEPPEAVRVCLGGIAPIESTRFALEVLADTLEESASVPAAELQISLS
jgi:hypothetical protein